MEKYIASIYNYYFSEGGKFIIYNSLSGEIAEVQRETFYNIRNNQFYAENIDWLLSKRLIRRISEVPSESEEALSLYKYVENSKRLQLTIIVTGQCNLRCVYCYEKFQKGKMSDETGREIVEYLKNVLPKYDSLYIGWFGGEPLLAIDVIESLSGKIVALCNSLGKTYNSSITTNGVLLTERIQKVLHCCKVDMFQITLDGNPEIHNRQRVTAKGTGSYEEIYHNLLSMRKSKFQFCATMRINVAPDAILDESFKCFFKRLYDDFGNDLRFNLHLASISNLSGEANGGIDICDTKHLEPYYKEAQKAGFGFAHYKVLFKPLHLICYAANPNAFVIDADGTVHKCTVGLDYELNNIGYLKHGKMILDEEKESLWYSHISQKDEDCLSCELLPTCLGKFCPLERMQGKNIPCPPMKKNLEMYMQLFI